MCHNRTGLGHFHDTMVSQNSSVWWLPCLFLRLIHCPNLCKNTDGTSATSKKLLSDQWESMRQWDVEKIHPGKLYSHADTTGRFHWCRPQRSQIEMFRTPKIADHGPISGVVQKELSPLQVFQAFKVFCVFECQRYAIKMSNCYQISYVIKYYELRLGKALTKLLGWQALGCGSRSWAMRSQDSQRQCPTAVTHAFHDDFDENWPTLHSFRRSME